MDLGPSRPAKAFGVERDSRSVLKRVRRFSSGIAAKPTVAFLLPAYES